MNKMDSLIKWKRGPACYL